MDIIHLSEDWLVSDDDEDSVSMEYMTSLDKRMLCGITYAALPEGHTFTHYTSGGSLGKARLHTSPTCDACVLLHMLELEVLDSVNIRE